MALGCQKDVPTQAEKDKDIILQYISDAGWSAGNTSSGLYYVIADSGSGNYPTVDSTVTVHYKGYFPNGEVFDQTGNDPAQFKLGHTIEGWQIGIAKFKEGGKGHLLIPSRLGYGEYGQGSIPGNSVLIFDIELLEVSQE